MSSRNLLRAVGFSALMITALIATGCGSDDDEPASASITTPSSSAFPVTIEHALGSTTIKSEPKRVVVVGYSDQEPLLALGVKPVGAMDWFGQGTFGKWPWERAAWGDKPAETVSNKSFEINFEKVASLRPDLILGLYADLDRTKYDKLSRIAPTVAQAKGTAYTTPWRDLTRTAAKAVGRVDQGERLIADVDRRFATFRKEHADLAGKAGVVVDAGNAPKSYYAFATEDPRGQFLRELGYKPPPAIEKLVKDDFGVNVSKERVDLLDVDNLFMLIDPPAQKRVDGDDLFNRLSVAREDRAIALPYYSSTQLGAAIAFNSVLSIPYALDGLAGELDR